jgi:hypothetical protein
MEFPLHITIKKPFGFDGFKFWRQSKKKTNSKLWTTKKQHHDLIRHKILRTLLTH